MAAAIGLHDADQHLWSSCQSVLVRFGAESGDVVSIEQKTSVKIQKDDTAIPQFEPFWSCRLCSSGGLLAKSHVYCPNCGHERDDELIVFPDWDDLVLAADHRFAGSDWSCCEVGWSARASYCGKCARRGTSQRQLVRQAERSVKLEVFSSFGFHLDVSGIDVAAFDEDESESNVVFLNSAVEGGQERRARKD